MPFETNFIGGLLMKEPDVPELQQISVQQAQKKAVKGNIKNFERIKTLGSETQEFMLDQLQRGMERLFPGVGKTISLATEALQSGLRGELPDDVRETIARQASERGFSMGVGGSQLAQFGELRDIGVSSLARIESSLDSALRWATAAQASTPTFDPSAFFVTPQFQAEFMAAERDRQFSRDFIENQIEAAYAPRTIAGQSLIQAGNEMHEFIMAIAGGAGGSGGGGGGMGGMFGGAGGGAGAAAAASDKNFKENFESINPEGILEKLKGLDITRWNYKGDPGVQHVGPMAQDFKAAFEVGGEQEVIHLVDALGVSLAAVKALSSRVEELERKLSHASGTI